MNNHNILFKHCIYIPGDFYYDKLSNRTRNERCYNKKNEEISDENYAEYIDKSKKEMGDQYLASIYGLTTQLDFDILKKYFPHIENPTDYTKVSSIIYGSIYQHDFDILKNHFPGIANPTDYTKVSSIQLSSDDNSNLLLGVAGYTLVLGCAYSLFYPVLFDII
jgi:hypothetical protein